ncbi:TetR/AcrR family transcriptional regulator [Jongsikchunia kroppenstedtii]|uniref:TetR/AcrR family transcriptional regulator n=1 Tax=Jongsikchunia kroppenstedtii TaxID=1121721 RepID=UPI00036D7751|nr:TetR/AcrR family transcriptional regulator [Jongsikchunia kroppenstedtii]
MAEGKIDQSARQRDTDSIVTAARALFAERGPARVSLREVAREAGVNYGLIHQYVGSKEALLRLVFTRSSAGWADAFSDADRLEDAIGLLLRPKSDTYVRMLAHLILEGRNPAELEDDTPALQALTRRLESELVPSAPVLPDPRIQAAVITGISMGWGLFGPYLRMLAGLTDLSQDELDRRVYDYVRQVFTERIEAAVTD